MEILKYCKLQICLLIVLTFISYLFIKDGNRLNQKSATKNCNHTFDWLFVFGELALLFDGITSYTVNHLDQIPELVNHISHLIFLLAYEAFMFLLFLYWLTRTNSLPESKLMKLVCYGPFIAIVLTTIISIGMIKYHIGVYYNYSSGLPAYACFLGIGLYELATLCIFIVRRNYIQKNRRLAFIVTLSAVCVITLIQMLFNETLVSSFAIILVIVSIYLCLENPSIKFLEFYHDEMITGFATLVENKDDSTGGHIRRSSAYAVLIAEELRKTKRYKNYITKDYIDTLSKAAPMHDIGKIGIPDSILQKPGKLTDEEFATMKKHPEIGGKIIRETFGHLDDDDYENMAYKVAIGHHEKWNGRGYPAGKKGTEIPLCARIMAVADVFDAVSAKRCYRDAMPLETCFKIIKDGRGQDFDPDVVDAFFSNQRRVEAVYHSKK